MERTPSGGHTGDASGAVHQGPRPLGAHQWGPDSNFFWKINIKLFPNLSIADAQLTSCVGLMPVPERSKSNSCFSDLWLAG